MIETIRDNKFNLLSSREGFNSALGHFKLALGFSDDVSEGFNLADALNESLGNREISDNQILPIINILLVDKFAFSCKSHNVRDAIGDVKKIASTLSAWNKIHMVLAVWGGDGKVTVINPADEKQWNDLPLTVGELLVLYAGPKGKAEISKDDLKGFLDDFFKLLYGANIKGKKSYSDNSLPVPKPVPVERVSEPEPETSSAETSSAPTGGSRRVSTKYGITVTNELFHNGNVEAWKKIIESYKVVHPGCDVLIWYDGERINDINALFKWGKVKRGNPIMFSVAGENIKNVAKLKKYLYEGASSRFEVFLEGPIGAVLELF